MVQSQQFSNKKTKKLTRQSNTLNILVLDGKSSGSIKSSNLKAFSTLQ